MEDTEQIIKNIEMACALCERDFSHEQITEILKGSNDIEKQICLLKLETLKTPEEADLLVFHLTNQHGIIREVCASKINELIRDSKLTRFFQTEKIFDTILNAIIDMNPNICRQIIEILPYIKNKDSFFEKLYERAIEVIQDASTMNIRNKGYIYSKKVFKIFWYLEAVSTLGYFEKNQEKKLSELLLKAAAFKDYTIREKAAKILSQIIVENKSLEDSSELSQLEIVLSEDENYFVRRFFV